VVFGGFEDVKGVSVGVGLHFLEEDKPHKIGTETAEWLSSTEF
jgi:haloalkane dehalogenase